MGNENHQNLTYALVLAHCHSVQKGRHERGAAGCEMMAERDGEDASLDKCPFIRVDPFRGGCLNKSTC